MLKGVNKQIVDIPQPESAYFERAIFFVKPECSGVSESKLRAKADEMVSLAAVPKKKSHEKPRKKIADFLHYLISAGIGAGVTALAFLVASC